MVLFDTFFYQEAMCFDPLNRDVVVTVFISRSRIRQGYLAYARVLKDGC